MSKSTYRTYLEKLGNTDAQSFIGQKGDLFFDPEVRALKVSDGVTAGGNAVSGGGGGVVLLPLQMEIMQLRLLIR